MNNTEKKQDMTVEEFVIELKKLKEQNEEGLAAALEKLAEIEDNEPGCEGAKYERWLEKYEDQQLTVDVYEENLEKIDSYLAEYDTEPAEGGV